MAGLPPNLSGKQWKKRSQKALLAQPTEVNLTADEQKSEKDRPGIWEEFFHDVVVVFRGRYKKIWCGEVDLWASVVNLPGCGLWFAGCYYQVSWLERNGSVDNGIYQNMLSKKLVSGMMTNLYWNHYIMQYVLKMGLNHIILSRPAGSIPEIDRNCKGFVWTRLGPEPYHWATQHSTSSLLQHIALTRRF